ncbi:MAG: DUF262 domain-containing protein [Polyangiaceae bacterium]
MKQASYLAEPYVSSIAQLIEDMEQGHLLVARFQRPLVWTEDHQLELLRSVQRGLPVGGILVWRTRGQKLACYDRIGRHRLRTQPATAGSAEQYVLDGFQRLSTLYSALQREPGSMDIESAEEAHEELEDELLPPRWYLHLEAGEFVTSEEEAPHLLPAWVLLDRMELLRRERKFSNEGWVEVAETVFAAFDRFKIPVSPLVTDDLEIAIQAFEKINSQVSKVGRLHSAHALSWSPEFDLLSEASRLKDNLLAPIGWSRLDDDALLEVCTLMLGLPLDGRQERVGKALRAKPETLREAVVALKMAAEFLQTEGIYRPDFVPYSRQVVLLAAALHPTRASASHELLSAWLWLTTYAELFTGISGGRFQRVHEELQRSGLTGILTWPGWRPFERRPLGGRLDLRSARARALVLRLAELSPGVRPGGEPVDVHRLQHENAATEVLCRALTREHVLAPLVVSAGNSFLVSPEHVAEFRDNLWQVAVNALDPGGEVAVPPLTLSWLEGHAVSFQALSHLANGHLDAFVLQREADLNRMEADFLVSHTRRLPTIASAATS